MSAGVVHAQNFLDADSEAMKRIYTSVSGLGWVTFEYFSKLLGVPGVKVDTMIARFVDSALVASCFRVVNNCGARTLVVDEYSSLQRGKTVSYFEHAI